MIKAIAGPNPAIGIVDSALSMGQKRICAAKMRQVFLIKQCLGVVFNDFSIKQVHNIGKIKPTSLCPDISNIRHPLSEGSVAIKSRSKGIRKRLQAMIGISCTGLKFTRNNAVKALRYYSRYSCSGCMHSHRI
jgi:hypothetical protein